MTDIRSISAHSILRREFISRSVETLAPAPGVCISPQLPMRQALAQLAEDRIGCLIVCDGKESVRPSGIFSDRDAVLRLQGPLSSWIDVPIVKFMTPNPQAVKPSASIAKVIHLMSSGGFRHVPVEATATAPMRILAVKHFIDRIHKRVTSRMLAPDSAMELDNNALDAFLGDQVQALEPDRPVLLPESATVQEALLMMRDQHRGAIAVAQGKHLRGIFTERDLISRVFVPNLDPLTVRLAEVMTPSPRTVLTTSSIALVFELLSVGGYRHLPVVNHEEALTGMVSVRHLLDQISRSVLAALA